MRRLLGRAAAIPILLWSIATLAFFLLRALPGSPLDRERAPASAEIEAALRAEYHLDEPLWQQYCRYLAGLLHGELGPSLKYRNRSVSEILGQALPVSMSLGLLGFLAAMGSGIPLGAASAVYKSRLISITDDWIIFLGLCVPAFVLGPLLVLLFGLWHSWLPVALWESWRHAILPIVALGLFFAARVSRLMHAGMAEALRSPYLRAARAKGLGRAQAAFYHAMPAAILPVVAYAGPMMADMLTGSFVIESVFQLPGVGGFFVNSLLNRDYTLMLGLTLVYSALVLTLNLVGDLVSGWLDPRIGKA